MGAHIKDTTMREIFRNLGVIIAEEMTPVRCYDIYGNVVIVTRDIGFGSRNVTFNNS